MIKDILFGNEKWHGRKLMKEAKYREILTIQHSSEGYFKESGNPQS
jgi:hypothetical protein